MSPMVTRALAAVATVAAVGGTLVAALAGSVPESVFCLGSLVAVTAGWVVVRHNPSSPVGPALAWSGACIAVVMTIEVLAASAYTDDPLPLSSLAKPLWVGGWPVNLAGIFVLLLVFPDGRRTGRLWAALPWIYLLATVGTIVGQWNLREVDGKVVGDLPSSRVVVTAVALPLIGICLVLTVAGVVLTYRHGTDRTRLQIRWLMLAGVIVVTLLLAGWVAQGTGLDLTIAFGPFLAAIILLVPLAVGIAIVRHDLFDIDRLLSTTATWVVTAVLSAGLFGLTVLLVAQLVSQRTGLGPAAAAFVTALALLPLHRYVAQVVGRLIDRDQNVAVATIDRFTADVRAGRREPEEVEAVLRDAQGDPELRLALAGPGGEWVGLDGSPTEPGSGFTVENHGDPVARITLGWESARARRRISELARRAWVPIEVSRLRLVLRSALADARASRARLAETTIAERRRLERDLHDGAQQQLLAIGMRLRALQRGLDPDRSAEVDTAVGELETTVAELRRLAHGIRPSRIDDGLEAALGAVRVATPLPFELDVEELPPLDDTRALTAYLFVSEAVSNVLKHASASRIQVRVAALNGKLAVDVCDDGIGGVPSEFTLTSLRDRVLSVGGSLRVDSPSGGGTAIRATL